MHPPSCILTNDLILLLLLEQSCNTNKRATIIRIEVYLYVFSIYVKDSKHIYTCRSEQASTHMCSNFAIIFSILTFILSQFQLKALIPLREYFINASTKSSKRSCHPTFHNKSIQSSSSSSS